MSRLTALPPTKANSWLAMQCRMIPGVVCAALFPAESGNAECPVPTACWPTAGETASAGLRVAAARALAKNKPVVCCAPQPPGAKTTPPLNLACPILIDGVMQGVIVVEMKETDQQRQRAVLQMLQWGSMWLQLTLQQQDAGASNDLPLKVLQIVAASLEHTEFQAAATACATELSTRLQCERVSFGFMQGKTVTLQALSNSANFDGQTNLARALELAMTEAVEQQATIAYPAKNAGNNEVVSANTHLCHQHKTGSVCTIPLSNEGTLFGAICFERLSKKPFTAANIKHFEAVAALLGPILELKRQQERHPLHQLWGSAGDFLHKLFGPSHPVLKLVAVLLAAVITAMSLVNGDYRSSGKAVLEGAIQRVVVAPMDGFIKTATVRPGDLVSAGQVLGSLEDQDLRLERLRWNGQLTQLQKEFREALGKHERSQIGILNAQIDQADAQLQLLDEQLARTEFTAPFDGVVVSGDLQQQLGAPVERGLVLFTVAPLNAYRVVVQVDEQDIFELAEGQTGQLVLSAQPDELMPLTVEKITPVSTAQDGRNYFRVEASLQAGSRHLRPGMQGIAKIDIEQRKLIWIWTHKLVNWLRLLTWSWLG